MILQPGDKRAQAAAAVRALLLSVVAPTLLGACMDQTFQTSVAFELDNFRPPCLQAKASKMGLPVCQNTTDNYYELWAVMHRSVLVRVKCFTVQPLYDVQELLDMERDGVILSNGKAYQVDRRKSLAEHQRDGTYDELIERLSQLARLPVVTGYSPTKFVPGTNRLNSDYFVGDYVAHSIPRNGEYLGVVNSVYPLGEGLEVGGGRFSSEIALEDTDNLFITIESAPPDRSNPTPSPFVLLSGTPEKRLAGVTTVTMVSDNSQAAAVFALMDLQDALLY